MGRKKQTIRGVARNVNWRQQSPGSAVDVLTFRLEQLDEEGNLLGYVSVIMEGLIRGNLADGDEVVVTGEFDKETGMFEAETIRNLRTNALIKVKKLSKKILIPIIIVMVIVLLAFLQGIISSIHGTRYSQLKPTPASPSPTHTLPPTQPSLPVLQLALIAIVVIVIVAGILYMRRKRRAK